MSAANVMARAGFLDRERIIVAAGYSRWLVPPCAQQRTAAAQEAVVLFGF